MFIFIKHRSKPDRIPSAELVKKNKDLFVHYWELYQDHYPERFRFQAMKALGTYREQSWHNDMFLSFLRSSLGWELKVLSILGTVNSI